MAKLRCVGEVKEGEGSNARTLKKYQLGDSADSKTVLADKFYISIYADSESDRTALVLFLLNHEKMLYPIDYWQTGTDFDYCPVILLWLNEYPINRIIINPIQSEENSRPANHPMISLLRDEMEIAEISDKPSEYIAPKLFLPSCRVRLEHLEKAGHLDWQVFDAAPKFQELLSQRKYSSPLLMAFLQGATYKFRSRLSYTTVSYP